ncbi:hypothetical protein Tco_0809509 [Tanacetum coccineum]
MNFSIFNCSEEDSVGKPLYSRFIKTNDFKGVPHPLSGDYTPTPQEEIDESLYVYGKKGPQEPEPSVSDDRSSEYSTCQSNDSAGSIGTSSEHSVDPESEISRVPPEVYVSTPITTNEKGVSAPKSKEVEPSCVSHIKTPRQPIKDQETPKVNRKNWNAMMERELGEGYSFTKKKCFVCGSLSHLIKDCDYYKKKMAREAEFKKQRVFNTGNMVAKPVWTNTDRINHANQFVPRPVQLNTGRPNINSVRTNINTDLDSQYLPGPQTALVLKDHRIIYCLGHITSNKDQLEDFEEFNGGSVTFGGSKGYITGKGRIRVGNLDFDSVSLVKELGHFNLFSISQICDKQYKDHPCTTTLSSPPQGALPRTDDCDDLTSVSSLITDMIGQEGDRSWKVFEQEIIVRLMRTMKRIEPEAQGWKSQDDPLFNWYKGWEEVISVRKETREKKVVTSWIFMNCYGYAEGINAAEGVNTSSIKVSTVNGQVSTDSIKKSIPSGEEQVEDISPTTLEAAKTLFRVASQKPKSIDKGRRIAKEEELNEQQKQKELKFNLKLKHTRDEIGIFIEQKIDAIARVVNECVGTENIYDALLDESGDMIGVSAVRILSFEKVKEEFDKLVKQVGSFAPINFEATKDSLKRFGDELQIKTSKRLKSDEAKDDELYQEDWKEEETVCLDGEQAGIRKYIESDKLKHLGWR